MHLLVIFSTVTALLCTVTAQSPNITSLVHSLLPPDSLDTSLILGQSLAFPVFTTTILTNDSHALVTINTTRPLASIGWVALGFGTKMSDASIVLLWPSSDGASWTLSHRSTTGHFMPIVWANYSAAPFRVLPALSSTSSDCTTVSFLRPLVLPSSQNLFWSFSNLNMSRARDQPIVWAFGETRPESMGESEVVSAHVGGAAGSVRIDLSQVFLAPSRRGEQRMMRRRRRRGLGRRQSLFLGLCGRSTIRSSLFMVRCFLGANEQGCC